MHLTSPVLDSAWFVRGEPKLDIVDKLQSPLKEKARLQDVYSEGRTLEFSIEVVFSVFDDLWREVVRFNCADLHSDSSLHVSQESKNRLTTDTSSFIASAWLAGFDFPRPSGGLYKLGSNPWEVAPLQRWHSLQRGRVMEIVVCCFGSGDAVWSCWAEVQTLDATAVVLDPQVVWPLHCSECKD